MMLIGHVNILQGTASIKDLSYGNTLPLVARPWGMTHWTMQTAEGPWPFHPDQPRLHGIRATHQPSPWMGDYGAVVFLPMTGPLRLNPEKRSSSYRANSLRPDRIDLRLLGYDTLLKLTPSDRGAVMEITFPGANEQRLLIEPVAGASWVQVLKDRRQIVGYTRGNNGGVPDNFASYYVLEFDHPFSDTACGGLASAKNPPQAATLNAEGERVGALVSFASTVRKVTARIAFSFISIEQARLNLDREVRKDVAALAAEAEQAWETVLGRILIDEKDPERLRTFYSCLYRCCLFPRVFHEYDAAGAMVHYSPFNGKVHPGPMYTDNGFWDTYRTLYPLLGLIDRPRFAEMMAGFLNAYMEGGWLPQWCSPGYRNCMIGTHSDAVMATALSADLPGLDVKLAYEATRKNAEVPGEGGVGRASLNDYLTLGYVPADGYHACSATLDFAYDDWCVAQLAKAAGDHANAARLLQRSKNYRHLFDPSVKFMRDKDRAGKFQPEPFDQFAWGAGYVEGGPWQHSWAVPHDPEGLIELYGGRQAFVSRLEQMLATPPEFTIGWYPIEIHEMTEMALVNFGQYAQSNQPVHHVLYLFAAAGRPDLTAHWARRVMREMYNPGVKGFPGDEDNGEMAAWYVLNAIGLFQLCPGDGKYWFGGPLASAELRPNGDRKLSILAESGRRKGDWILHQDLLKADQLLL